MCGMNVWLGRSVGQYSFKGFKHAEQGVRWVLNLWVARSGKWRVLGLSPGARLRRTTEVLLRNLPNPQMLTWDSVTHC